MKVLFFIVLALLALPRYATSVHACADKSQCGVQNELQITSQQWTRMECKTSEVCVLGLLSELCRLQMVITHNACYLQTHINQREEHVLSELSRINTSKEAVSGNDLQISSSLSQIDELVERSRQVVRSLQESMQDFVELDTNFMLFTERIQLHSKNVRRVTDKATTLQQNSTVQIEIITDVIEIVEESIREIWNAVSAINSSTLLINSTQTRRFNGTLQNASLTAQQARIFRAKAASSNQNTFVVTDQLDTAGQLLVKITEWINEVNTSSVSTLHQRYSLLFRSLQGVLEKAYSINLSIISITIETKFSLNESMVMLNGAENAIDESVTITSMVSYVLMEYLLFEEQLSEHAASVMVAWEHAIMLSEQAESVAVLSGALDTASEAERLLAIQEIAENSINISNHTKQVLQEMPQVQQQAQELQERGEKLLQSVRMIDSMLSGLTDAVDASGRRTEELHLDLVNATQELNLLLERIDHATAANMQIERGLRQARRDNNRAERRIQNSNSRLNGVSLLADSIRNFTMSSLENVVAANNSISSTETLLEQGNFPFPVVRNRSIVLNESLEEISILMQDLRDTAEDALQVANYTFNFLDVVNLPLGLSGNVTIVPTIENSSGEFHSISLQMTPLSLENSTLVHLTNTRREQTVSLTAGILNGNVVASFVRTINIAPGAHGYTDTIISARRLNVSTLYRVEITRGEEDTNSTTVSNMIAMQFRAGFLQDAELYVGGVPEDNNVQDTPFSSAGKFSGCVSQLRVNGHKVNVWNVAAYTPGPNDWICESSACTEPSKSPLISFNGQTYATSKVDGNMLPLHLEFRTLRPNGLLLYARNEEEASSLQISLSSGMIVVRVSAGSRQRTLTSSMTYHTGATHSANLTLTNSGRALLLISEIEETTRGLRFIETREVANYTELFVGGALEEVGRELNVANFTGCARMSTLANISPEVPMCMGVNNVVGGCAYCSTQPAASASFYGRSYVSFPSLSITDHFDLSFSFKTAFQDGLLFYSGNASRSNWLAVSLISSRIHLIFRSLFGALDLPARSAVPLADDQWHTVSIVRVGSSLEILVDGVAGGNFEFFGDFLPSGSLGTNLYLGGISPQSLSLIPFGISSEGLKGCLDTVFITGRPVDFSINVGLQAVALDVCSQRSGGENEDVYFFDGSALAEYDLGRLGVDFAISFQFRTSDPDGLILYIFSTRREDSFVLQLLEGKLQLYTTDGEIEVLLTSEVETADGLWHTAVAEKSGNAVRLIVDQDIEMVTITLSPLRTNTPLYVGGLPDVRRIPSNVTSQQFSGCLRMSFLSQSVLSNVQENDCQLGAQGA